MVDVAFAPTWQRRPRRGPLVLAIVIATAILLYASGPRYVANERDLTCAEGFVAVPASIASWAYRCERQADCDGCIQWTRTVAIERRYALYLTNIDVRVFEIDRVAGQYLGPGHVPFD